MKLFSFTLIIVASLAMLSSAEAAPRADPETSCEEAFYDPHKFTYVQQCDVAGAHVTIMIGEDGEATCKSSSGNLIVQIGYSHDFSCEYNDCNGFGNVVVAVGDQNNVNTCTPDAGMPQI